MATLKIEAPPSLRRERSADTVRIAVGARLAAFLGSFVTPEL
jgi:hypothetical protein